MPFLFLQLFLIIDSNIISKNRFLCKHKLTYWAKNFCLISVRRENFHRFFLTQNMCLEFTISSPFINNIHSFIHSFCGKLLHIRKFSTLHKLINPHKYAILSLLSTSYAQSVDNFCELYPVFPHY